MRSAALCALVGCAHAPRAASDSREATDEALLARCRAGVLQACTELRDAWLFIDDSPGTCAQRERYAEPAAKEACELNPAACEYLVWLEMEVLYQCRGQSGSLLEGARADLASACEAREQAYACARLGDLLQKREPGRAAHFYVAGCRLLASSSDEGCCRELLGLYESGQLAAPHEVVEALEAALVRLRTASAARAEGGVEPGDGGEAERNLGRALDALEGDAK